MSYVVVQEIPGLIGFSLTDSTKPVIHLVGGYCDLHSIYSLNEIYSQIFPVVHHRKRIESLK